MTGETLICFDHGNYSACEPAVAHVAGWFMMGFLAAALVAVCLAAVVYGRRCRG